MDKFSIGEVCIFNKDNDIPMSGTKIVFVKVCDIKFSFRYLSNYYICKTCDKDGNIVSDTPIPTLPKNLSKVLPYQIVVVRYPEDVPIIKKDDVDLIKTLNSLAGTQLPESYQKKVAMLILKLELFSKIINEY